MDDLVVTHAATVVIIIRWIGRLCGATVRSGDIYFCCFCVVQKEGLPRDWSGRERRL